MNPVIIKVVETTHRLRFRYKGKARCVEPHTYGRQADGADALCAWQVSGGSGEDYRYFYEREMSDISVDGDAFAGPRPGYHRGDHRFSTIWAEL